MESTLVSLLQTRMDKCTREQFWAVAAVTGLNTFLITRDHELAYKGSSLVVILFVSFLTSLALCYIWHRHKAYYVNRQAQANLLKDVEEAPDFLRTCRGACAFGSLLGSGLYTLWIVFGWAAMLVVLLSTK